MGNFYYDKLTDPEKAASDAIYTGLKQGSEEISVKTIGTLQEMRNAFQAVEYDHPEFFNVNFSYYSHSSGHTKLYPEYIYGYGQREEKRARIEAKANEIIGKMKAAKANTVAEKCLWLHNYIVRNCTYNRSAKENHNAHRSAYSIEGVLLEGTAVCKGIAMAYKYLCDRLGIESIVATGFSLEPGCTEYGLHAWNIVMSGGAATQLDVTWDMCLTKEGEPIRYDYFFMPDIEMMRDHQYVGYPLCNNRQLNMFAHRKLLFTSVDGMDEYVGRAIKKADKDRMFLYFKMKNQKETKEEIVDYIGKCIRKNTNKGYSMKYTVCNTQSVFYIDVTFSS